MVAARSSVKIAKFDLIIAFPFPGKSPPVTTNLWLLPLGIGRLVRFFEAAFRRLFGVGRRVSHAEGRLILRERVLPLILQIQNASQIDVAPGSDARVLGRIQRLLKV